MESRHENIRSHGVRFNILMYEFDLYLMYISVGVFLILHIVFFFRKYIYMLIDVDISVIV